MFESSTKTKDGFVIRQNKDMGEISVEIDGKQVYKIESESYANMDNFGKNCGIYCANDIEFDATKSKITVVCTYNNKKMVSEELLGV